MSSVSEYQASLDYLYGFVNYERKMTEVYAPEKMDPERPLRLLALLDDPHRQYPTLHIAGTKGKGSVAAMCAFALRAAGLKVGLYTSPHLVDFRERIRVLTPDEPDGRIRESEFVQLVERLRSVVARVPGLTWFELVTAIGFMHFAEAQVDVAVVEVGLGGRLDATNVVAPLVSVITSLSLDHTALLGETLPEIAREKAGIIKPAVPVVSAAQAPEALQVIAEVATAHGAPLQVVGQDWSYDATPAADLQRQHLRIKRSARPDCIPPGTEFDLSLLGPFQQENGCLALAALCQVQSRFPELTLEGLRAGLAEVMWPGRLQILSQGNDGPTLVADCAHNPDSIRRLVEALHSQFSYERLWLVLGITADKAVPEMLATLLPEASGGTLVAQAEHPRAETPEGLRAAAAALGHTVQVVPKVTDAVAAALAAAAPSDLVCVTGSIFVVGELLNYWESLKSTVTIPTGDLK